MVGIRKHLLLATMVLIPSLTISSLSFAQIKVEPAPEKSASKKSTENSTQESTAKKAEPKKSGKAKSEDKKSAAAKPASNVLFEGWNRVLSGGVPVGYFVQRYEFDQKKKEFLNTYYLRTNVVGGSVTESLKARADSGLKPLEFQYTELVGGKAKLIEAKFQGENMTAIVTEPGKQPVTIRKSIPKGTFLSSFLVYMMLSAKEGISVGARYGYNAIAEEDGGIYPGEASIAAQETVNGHQALKVFNKFKNVQFVSYITQKGEAISTRSPTQGISTELVATQEEAIKGQAFTPSQITSLFGEIPKGKVNPVAIKAASDPVQLPTVGDKTDESAPTKLEAKEAAPEKATPEKSEAKKEKKSE